MFNRAAWRQGLHMTIAAFCATGFAVAGIHAIGLLKNPASVLHAEAFKIALTIGASAAVLQPLQGDRLAKQTAVLQPAKLAAWSLSFKPHNPLRSLSAVFLPRQPKPSVLGYTFPGF
jgi:cytochrome d ubiquinol oxidase subunit I